MRCASHVVEVYIYVVEMHILCSEGLYVLVAKFFVFQLQGFRVAGEGIFSFRFGDID